MRLYGRNRIIDFVDEALRRKGVPDRPLPVVLLVGPHGSGGTAVLDRLDRNFHDRPSARLDIASARDVRTIVFAAMQGLRRKVSGVGAIPFPRLELGIKALSFDATAGVTFDAYLREHRRIAAFDQAMHDWVRLAGELLPPEQRPVVDAASQAFDWLLAGAGRRVDREPLQWYAANGISSAGAGTAPLRQLYDWQHEGTDDAARRVEKTLCAALLADLRADFNEFSLRHGRRVTNCLLLVDNVDTELADRFLELLTECRRESHTAAESADPLLVVAARRGRPPDGIPAPVDATADDMGFAAWHEATLAHEHPDLWYPVRLTDLTLDDASAMVTSSVFRTPLHDADFVHALTGGHPAATALLTAALGEAAGEPGFDPRTLIDRPGPG